MAGYHRPFWSKDLPWCLYCGWDDFGNYPEHSRPHGGSRSVVFAADRGHEYVGWLCDDCADDETRVHWFARTVKQRYPDAWFVLKPGTSEERKLSANPDRFVAMYRERRGRPEA